MLFSYNLINRLIDLSSVTIDDVVKRLTFSGFEVESVHPLASASSLVIGEIISCEPIPGSDHLHALEVDCGQDGIRNIVCGAPNARVGIKVIVALPGCELRALNTTIKKSTLHGFESDGMCCSLAELGLDRSLLSESENAGIHELPKDAPVGLRDVLSYLHLDDTILDIDVLPNRPDCLSYLGIARELSGLFSLPINKLPEIDLNQYPSLFDVTSQTDKCPRFDLLGIRNIIPREETPDFIKAELIASGIRSISPIVDLGNYSMLITGQPLNLYDASLNPSHIYSVRDDHFGEFKAFDGRVLRLKKGDLVIFDETKPVSLAGILAGENESITSKTDDIAIEAACFYHANIRRTAQRLGVSSFSQQLFAKSRNPYLISESLKITISLLPLFFISYEIYSYSSYSSLPERDVRIAFSLEKMNHRLGSSYTAEQVDEVLRNYRISKDEDGYLIPPLDRTDLCEQCDIEEEIFRYYPADMITPSLDDTPITIGSLTSAQRSERKIRQFLIDQGFDEIISFTLIDSVKDGSIRVFSKDPGFRVQNPMTKDHEIVRSDLLPSMLETINYNLSHKNDDLSLFEISAVDTPSGDHLYLSLGLTGRRYLSDFSSPREVSFLDLKGVIFSILELLGITDTRIQLVYSRNEAFHPFASADIIIDKKRLLGTFGQLHPRLSSSKILLGEIDLGALFSIRAGRTRFTAYPTSPAVRRDLSLKLRPGVSYLDIKRTITTSGVKILRSVDLFDIFTDEETGDSYIGVMLQLGKDDGTLTDEEINSAVEKITNAVESKLGLTLRGRR